MTTLATLLPELIELICECLANYVLEDWEFGSITRNENYIEYLSRYVVGLPLIHSRWTVPGQKALYGFVILPTANRYKRFQQSLTAFPHNGFYVRGIALHRGGLDLADLGGPYPNGCFVYTEIIGWSIHEMEIQQLVRLCPFLECFHPGVNVPVISQEEIAALGNIDSIRAITWRAADFEQYGDAINRAQSGWLRLETIEILGEMRKGDFQYIQAVSERLRTLKIHDHHPDLTSHLESWSLDNLVELDLSTTDPLMPNMTRIFEICGSNLVALTIPYPYEGRLDILDTVVSFTPRLRHLRIVVFLSGAWNQPPLWLPVQYRFTQNQSTKFGTWSSKSLRSVRFDFRGNSPFQNILPKSFNFVFDSFMRADAFPNLRKILKVDPRKLLAVLKET